jgi:hypothetical protein
MKPVENKFNKFIENYDPKKLEDEFVEYTIGAINDIVDGDSDIGYEKLDSSIKFFQDQKHIHPQAFSRASKRINKYSIKILAVKLEDSEKSIQIMKLTNTIDAIIELMEINFIQELIMNYKEEKDENDLKQAIVQINNLKNSKIERLDKEIFPNAIKELNHITPEISDKFPREFQMLHEQFIRNIKKDVKDSESKLNKKK